MGTPATQYAWNARVALAYQVIGDGPVDLLYLQGRCSHVDMNWESRDLATFLRALARHTRLIITDRRGFGCSDRFSPSDIPPFEVLTDDILTVMEAAGSDRTAIFGTWDCALIAMLCAAVYPERVAALILLDPFITYASTPETPWMPTAEEWEERIATGALSGDYATPDESEREWFRRYARASVGPGAHKAEIRRYLATDVRPILSLVHVPTLILQDADGTEATAPEAGQYLHTRIPGSKLVEIPWKDQHHWYWGADAIVTSIDEFLAGIRDVEAERGPVLATVMFTDIVGSTELVADLGDRRWRNLVQQHHATARALLARYKGKEVDTAGDGFFATFDGPVRALRCAIALADAVRNIGVEIRAGVHIGECEVIDNKVGGLAVNVGSRICALARPSEVWTSQTVKDLVVGSGFSFEDEGSHHLKGVPGEWRLFALGSD